MLEPDPPHWICHGQFCKFDLKFRISNLKSLTQLFSHILSAFRKFQFPTSFVKVKKYSNCCFEIVIWDNLYVYDI